MPLPHAAGLLVPVFALRHARDFGIGDTLAVKDALTFCRELNLGVLQLLPIHDTVGDHSPYNPISSRALSPAYLDLSPDTVPGLTIELLERLAPETWLARLREGGVKHHTVQPLKLHILLAAWDRFKTSRKHHQEAASLWREFESFQEDNADWLRSYTLYRLLIREYEGNPNWSQWRPEHQNLAAAESWYRTHPAHTYLADLRQGFAYIQWVAWRQWRDVRKHAEDCGVRLMGEMSFGVSKSGVDTWAWPNLFDMEWNLGTRPIVYFDTNKDSERWGQNWGLPPCHWEHHRSTGFAWLRGRVAAQRQFFHLCRLDHLRGYFRSYMFPWPGGARHAEYATLSEEEIRQHTGGRWPRFVPGPDDDPVSAAMNEQQGRELLGVMRDAAQGMGLIGEIMGNMPGYMRRTLDDLAIGSLVFPLLERDAGHQLLPPSSYRLPSLAAYANHDHAPLAASYLHLLANAGENHETAAAQDLANLLQFAGWKAPAPPALEGDLLGALQEALLRCPSELAVFLSSDLLGIPQRFNLPGSYGADTWSERLELPLPTCLLHPVFAPRLTRLRQYIQESGRSPV